MRRRLIPAVLISMFLIGIEAAGGAVIRGTGGPDRINGTLGADELYGRGGDDRLEGRGGSDLLDGGAGRDRLSGGGGDDRLAAHGDRRVDTVSCGARRDIVNAELSDRVGADCDVVSRQLSRDTTHSSEGQHETQVEPDSFAFGSTIVTVFQTSRFMEGGAANIGFATSRDAGRTWRSGLLPGLSMFSAPPGSSFAVSDPAIAYDAVHRMWLAASLGGGIGPSELMISRSRNGVTWNLPVRAGSGEGQEYDKEWIVCDNWRRSHFRGRCYLSYMNFSTNVIETRRSANGGRTWSAPVVVEANRRPASVNGVQPVVRPNGDLVLVFAVFGALVAGTDEIAAARSTDGGASFSQPVRVAPLSDVELNGMRAPPFPSAEVDGGGTIYLAWSGCLFREFCEADIVLTSSRDGLLWAEPTRVPIGAPETADDQFLPAIAVDPSSSNRKTRIAVLYHSLRALPNCYPVSFCLVVDVGLTISRDAGSTWTSPQRLNVTPMRTTWIAETSLGRMLGDYVSASWVQGRPIPVFSLASEPSRGLFRQAIFATTRGAASR